MSVFSTGARFVGILLTRGDDSCLATLPGALEAHVFLCHLPCVAALVETKNTSH